jgi:hypothetical protein
LHLVSNIVTPQVNEIPVTIRREGGETHTQFFKKIGRSNLKGEGTNVKKRGV